MTLSVHVVAHTHWDREWYLTREQFRLRLVDLVDRVLVLLEADPGFAFHLDGQTIVLEDYLELRPEQEERLRRHIASGRLLVGPWYVMPDQFLVSGEALVRNLALGHRIAAGYGRAMAVGYIPDPFGHVAQMPQLLRGFGLDSAVLWRGLDGPRAEYVWEAPDGSGVLLLHLPEEGYCNALWLPLVPPERMAQRAAEVMASEGARTASGAVLLMAGVDHVEPHPRLRDLLRWLGAWPGVQARLSTLPAYVEDVRAGVGDTPLEIVRGELRGGEQYAFLLPGVLSTRVYLKQANARVQRELESWAEPASVLAWLQGEPWPGSALAYAWRTLLQNHPHDSICGCSIDAVHEENLTRFARAGQVADELTARALAALARSVPRAEEGARMLVVNTDARTWPGVAEVVVELPYESDDPGRHVPAERLDAPLSFIAADAPLTAVLDSTGQPVAFQLLEDTRTTMHLLSRYEPPWAVRARRLRVALHAGGVPGLGFTCFDLRFGGEVAEATAREVARAGEHWLENGRLRVSVAGDGTLEVRDLASGHVLAGCATLIDEGDVGDEYTYSPPRHDRRVTSGQGRVVATRLLHRGPLRAELEVSLELALPSQAAADRTARSTDQVAMPVTMRVALDAGASRVGLELELDNRARDHRLRLAFPLGPGDAVTSRADSAFALVERPARRPAPAEFRREAPVSAAPLLSFVDAGDAKSGCTVLADGLCEYEVVEIDGARWLAVTLLRCVGALSRDDLATRRGHAGPGMATPGAQCMGRHAFRLAFAPRAAPPAAVALFAQARAFLAPPRAVVASAGAGRAERWAALNIEGDGVMLSALAKAQDRDSLVLRFFNPGAAPAGVRITLPAGIEEAHQLDLLERRQRRLALSEGGLAKELRPHGVETLEVVPRWTSR